MGEVTISCDEVTCPYLPLRSGEFATISRFPAIGRPPLRLLDLRT
jgi:hypothetical protein